MRAVVLLLAACAARPPTPVRARVVPVVAGDYHVEKSFRSDDTLEMHGVSLELAPDGVARLSTQDAFMAWGEPAHDDRETTDYAGRWKPAGDGITVDVTQRASCEFPHGIECMLPRPPPPWPRWRLRCNAMKPQPGSPLAGPALVCRFLEPEPIPRYGVRLVDEYVLVLGGPDNAIRYSTRL